MNVLRYFHNSWARYPNNVALEINDHTFTYDGLWQYAASVYHEIIHSPYLEKSAFIGIMAYRSDLFYASVLAILATGKAYMPFNPKVPPARNGSMIESSGVKILIVGTEFNHQMGDLGLSGNIQVITPASNRTFLPDATGIHQSARSEIIIHEVNADDPAYLLFTSGSTGMPKGIPVSHANLNAYVEYIRNKYPLTESDKCSQAFDTTFDLSVHDLFITWSAGACLCVLSPFDLISPINYIRNHNLSVWFSVPSMISSLIRMRLLKPGQFESIRLSFFCGESFTVDTAQKWMEAAPNSRVFNLYGPTETTIAVSEFEVKEENLAISKNGVVSIGKVFSNHNYAIVDDNLEPLSPGQSGELCISGPQVCSGYWKNEEKTIIQFVTLGNDKEKTWYRTGDLVMQDQYGYIDFLGRIDFQVKIRGYRIELQDIEANIQKFINTQPVLVASYPVDNPIADYLVAFVPRESAKNEKEIIQYCTSILPDYMVPRKVYYIDHFPVNINGKIDRKELSRKMKENL